MLHSVLRAIWLTLALSASTARSRAVATSISSLLLCFSANVIAAEETSSAEALDELIMIHEVRVAFYEAPPRSLLASMRKAVERECAERLRSGKPQSTDPDDDPGQAWLCTGDIHFVRGVDVLGNRHNTGFVCEGAANLKLYTDDMFVDEPNCISVCYSAERRSHFLLP